jgi:multiple sugar transport system permease protein
LATDALTLEQARDHDPARHAKFFSSRVLIYGTLLLWAFICLFPIYWTVTTSFKTAVNVTQGHLVPWVDYHPDWKGWRSLGLSPDTIGEISTVRDEFLMRFENSILASVGASLLAVVIGSLAAYGLSRFQYKFGPWRNKDISFFFLSQLILPPVVLAMPFLVLYKELALLDTKIGLILVYTLMVLPIVIWIMRDQFDTIPQELEQAALVDGCTVWGAFLRIVLPIALPGMVAAFILSVVLCWNEYFFAALLTSTDAKTLPVMVASQTGSQGINWWSMAALSHGGDRPARAHRRLPRALHRERSDRRRGQVAAPSTCRMCARMMSRPLAPSFAEACFALRVYHFRAESSFMSTPSGQNAISSDVSPWPAWSKGYFRIASAFSSGCPLIQLKGSSPTACLA